MTELLELVPRAAGVATLEPGVVFDETDQALAAQDRCPISCMCTGSGTDACTATGRTFAE